MKVLSLIAICIGIASAAVVASPQEQFPSEFYGYIPINTAYDSAMFYVIRGDTNETVRSHAPLVMWLQGGPGASSLFGDFLETGPIKIVKQGAPVNRVHTWVKYANMLYVDNPVGTGFSYTKDPKGFSTTDDDIAANLLKFLIGFSKVHPEYNGRDFWVFCESYGGKMTAYFGALLTREIANKNPGITVNFKGVALGDGWVDPVGCMKSYGSYLSAFSQVNSEQVKNISAFADKAEAAVQKGNGQEATNLWNEQQGLIGRYTDNINWYNMLYYYDYTAEGAFDSYMSAVFAPAHKNIIPSWVTFGGQSSEVFAQMEGSFMLDGIQQVVEMIKAGVEVNVYCGQLDLIVDVQCTQGWVTKAVAATYKNLWMDAPRIAHDNGNEAAPAVYSFEQKYKNFAFWQIMDAGHMVPLDNPPAAEHMFISIIGAKSATIHHQSASRVLHVRRPRRFRP